MIYIFSIVSGIDAEFPIVIELQAIVRQITFDKKTKKYKIRTFDRQQYEADIAIVAVPLGILRKGEIVFGEPQKNSSSSVANMPQKWHDTVRNKLGKILVKILWCGFYFTKIMKGSTYCLPYTTFV